MHPLNKKTWAGFAFVSLCTLLCCLYPIVGWDLPETVLGGADPDCFLAVVLFAYLVLLAGVILLLRGKPAGGIVGAMGSVAFLPVGLLTLIGCLQCRKRLRQMEAPAGAARGTAALGQFSPVLWLGLALCVLSFITYLSMGTESGGVDTAVSAFLLAGLLLSLAGMILLARGDPAGGIVGAVSSACVIPLGAICLVGCMVSRDRLRRAARAAARDAVHDPSAGQEDPGREDLDPKEPV